MSKNKHLWNDVLVAVCFILMLTVKFFTLYNFTMIQEFTGVEIEQIATAYEGNDFFKIQISLQKIGYVLGGLILPAMLIALYLYNRRKVNVGKMDMDSLSFFVQFTFFMLLLNIVNDGASFIAFIIRGG